MFSKTINILGTEYEIKTSLWQDDKYMQENGLDGYCAEYGKSIVVVDPEDKEYFKWFDSKEEIEKSYKETVRHEVFHAYLNESGLSSSSAVPTGGWAKNEEMIDWFAIQSPKIFKTFQVLLRHGKQLRIFLIITTRIIQQEITLHRKSCYYKNRISFLHGKTNFLQTLRQRSLELQKIKSGRPLKTGLSVSRSGLAIQRTLSNDKISHMWYNIQKPYMGGFYNEEKSDFCVSVMLDYSLWVRWSKYGNISRRV